MNDKYTVINKKEPRGQSVAENRIPCNAKYCVAQLNRLSQDNEKLKARLKLLSDFTEDFTQQINRSIMAENHILTEKVQGVNELLNDLFKELNRNWAKASKSKKEIDIVRAEAQLNLITSIIDEIERI